MQIKLIDHMAVTNCEISVCKPACSLGLIVFGNIFFSLKSSVLHIVLGI